MVHTTATQKTMKKLLSILTLFLCLLLFPQLVHSQEDNSETELQGILDAFEDDKSESVEGMKVDLKSIQFQTGTDKLVETDTKYIDRILDYFKSLPTVLLVIEGHTDNVGNKKSNQALSEKRALAVKNYLVQKGVSAGRIKTAGFGPTQPIASNDTDEGRKQNRRVELKFSGVSHETHTINLASGEQVKAQFIMINRDGSIGYKETLKSPMKKLKAPEIRNIAFHGGANFVPQTDPMVMRKVEEAIARALKEAEDPQVKEQQLREKKMREELLLKEQQLREQQAREQKLREDQAAAAAMKPGESWFGKFMQWVFDIRLGRRTPRTAATQPSNPTQTGTSTQPGSSSQSGGSNGQSPNSVQTGSNPELPPQYSEVRPARRQSYTQSRLYYGAGVYPLNVKGDNIVSYNAMGSTSTITKTLKSQTMGIGGIIGLEFATRREYTAGISFLHALNSSANSSRWTFSLGKGFGEKKNFKTAADLSLSHVQTALDKNRKVLVNNAFITLTPNISIDFMSNQKGKLRLNAGFSASVLRAQNMKFRSDDSIWATYRKLNDSQVDFRVDGVRRTDWKLFDILGPHVSLIQIIH
jgi:outer membrane protein OmpA-like peptidoglycan-associated protein